MAHTPGPWAIGFDGVIRCADGFPPYSVRRSPEEVVANGRLMSTAPELLDEAIKARATLITALDDYKLTENETAIEVIRRRIATLTDVIAKAQGVKEEE